MVVINRTRKIVVRMPVCYCSLLDSHATDSARDVNWDGCLQLQADRRQRPSLTTERMHSVCWLAVPMMSPSDLSAWIQLESLLHETEFDVGRIQAARMDRPEAVMSAHIAR